MSVTDEISDEEKADNILYSSSDIELFPKHSKKKDVFKDIPPVTKKPIVQTPPEDIEKKIEPVIEQVTNAHDYCKDNNIDITKYTEFMKTSRKAGIKKDDANGLWKMVKHEKDQIKIAEKSGGSNVNIAQDIDIHTPFDVTTSPDSTESAEKKFRVADDTLALYNHDVKKGYRGSLQQWMNDSAVNLKRKEGVEVAIIEMKPGGERHINILDKDKKDGDSKESSSKVKELKALLSELGFDAEEQILQQKLEEHKLNLESKHLDIEKKKVELEKSRPKTEEKEKEPRRIPMPTGKFDKEGEPVIVHLTPEEMIMYNLYQDKYESKAEKNKPTSVTDELEKVLRIAKELKGDNSEDTMKTELRTRLDRVETEADKYREQFHNLSLNTMADKYTELMQYVKNQPSAMQKYKEAKEELSGMGINMDDKSTQTEILANTLASKVDVVAERITETMKPVFDGIGQAIKQNLGGGNQQPPMTPQQKTQSWQDIHSKMQDAYTGQTQQPQPQQQAPPPQPPSPPPQPPPTPPSEDTMPMEVYDDEIEPRDSRNSKDK